ETSDQRAARVPSASLTERASRAAGRWDGETRALCTQQQARKTRFAALRAMRLRRCVRLGDFAEAVVERVAGASDGADRIGNSSAVQRLPKSADVHIDRPFVDIDVAAPHTVEQLLARKHPPRTLHQKLEQAKFRGTKADLAS